MALQAGFKYEKEGIKHVFHERSLSELEKISDDLLWEKFVRKEEGAFTFIYSKYVNVLFNFGCQFAGDREIVKDCIQDLFIRLRGSENAEKIISIKSYLYKCLYRDLIRRVKKEKKYSQEYNTFSMDLALPYEHTLIDQQISEQQMKMLKSAIKQLTERQRQIILLFYYENLSYGEISEILGMRNVKSTRKLLYRALDKLKFLFRP